MPTALALQAGMRLGLVDLLFHDFDYTTTMRVGNRLFVARGRIPFWHLAFRVRPLLFKLLPQIHLTF